ncbi:MAG TPA: histidine phosphatase family protein [Acidimicrobiaceae bacterium]|nr:histidine phosphatase family protein [Acidimicrobiaceae bacterium]
MELILIRHALPVRRELEEGIADPELSPAGRAQAQHLAEYLASEPIDALYTSPLLRARETAEPLASMKGLEVVVVDDVAEWDRNSNEYIPAEELKAAGDPRWKELANGMMGDADETPEEFRGRVVAALEALIERHPGQRVAVTCHGGVVNAYLSHVLGLPPTAGFFYPNYTSLHRVAASRGGHRSIVTINETSHLRGTGLPMGVVQQS